MKKGSQEEAWCEQEQANLKTSKTELLQLIDKFKQELRAAVNAQSNTNRTTTITSTGPSGRATAQGEYHLITKDGRKLSGAEALNVPLNDGARILTGPNGKVKISLPDETVFVIGADADIVIDEFIYDPNGSPRKILVQITKGLFRWVTGKVARSSPENMKVKLPHGDVGIRGTDFETSVAPDKSGYVKLFSGLVDFTAAADGSKLTLKAGEMFTFDSEGNLTQSTQIK